MEKTKTGGLGHGIGEFVVYRNSGIYRISDIRQENLRYRGAYILCYALGI